MSAKVEKQWALVVNGDLSARQAICALVKGAGDFGVVEAGSGTEALHKIARQQFRLMIADNDLPQMGGPELLENIRCTAGDTGPTRILMISDRVPRTDASRGTDKVVFLAKPFAEAQMRELVRLAMDGGAHPVPPMRMDVNFINPFIEATLKVLAVTAGTQAQKDSVFLRRGDQITGDISAVVAMNSSQFCGSMAISFEQACFLSVVNQMLGETYREINSENADAVGELCNQIFGGAKRELNERGCDIQPAIPSVIYGKDHHIKHLIDGPCLAVRFRTSTGCFVVEAIIKVREPQL